MFVTLASVLKNIVSTLTVAAVLSGSLSVADASPTTGRYEDDDVLRAGHSMTYTIRFQGSETAHVVAAGNGDIDIYIYDENDHLITKDVDGDNRPICRWTPKWTGKFKVKIVNTENHAVDYAMIAD